MRSKVTPTVTLGELDNRGRQLQLNNQRKNSKESKMIHRKVIKTLAFKRIIHSKRK